MAKLIVRGSRMFDFMYGSRWYVPASALSPFVRYSCLCYRALHWIVAPMQYLGPVRGQ